MFTHVFAVTPSSMFTISATVAFLYGFISILNAAIRIAGIIFSCFTFFMVNLFFS